MELPNIEEKEKIMRNKHKLRNVGNRAYYINNDLSKRERSVGKHIRIRVWSEKQKEKEVKIGVRKLTIEGEEWRWNKEKEELEKTDRPRNRMEIGSKYQGKEKGYESIYSFTKKWFKEE
ncbi:ketimine reductase mu-crystallin [Holotrichia oblita]|uniref:Ketimine reductase mu-crystallin n=1 Tax=Holotrichia oblita TaxID=644536 RepID=A0ACB9SND7_HOLOL|nr:ketimine reductase mu-crystallin [Holotrichia oblita]